MKALVGYTGFVGSNLRRQTRFDALFNSKNIQESYDHKYDLLVYAGVRAEKFLANHDPFRDRQHIEETIETLTKIKTKKLVLISTIDIYDQISGVDENSPINEAGLQTYGLHRRILEKWVMEYIPSATVIRLPALYGENLRKNFIFDMINLIPTMIKEQKYRQLAKEADINLDCFYTNCNNGFYKVKELSTDEKRGLRLYFKNNEFNALSFTDCRNEYPFYNLQFLWEHIQIAIKNNLPLLNITTEPVSAKEVYQFIYQGKFNNILPSYSPLKYKIYTVYDNLFDGQDGYIFGKEFVLKDLASFIKSGELI